MLPQTGDRHRGVARCAGELGGLDNWGFLFPGTYWLCVVHHFHRYIILAAGGAGVAHTTGPDHRHAYMWDRGDGGSPSLGDGS